MQTQPLSYTNSRNSKLLGTCWEAPDTKAVVALVHGQGEHGARYQHMAEYYTTNGFSILFIDHPGHGASDGKRGHVEDYGDYLEVVDLLLKEAASRFPGKPVFIYGHSMGGNIALNYILKKAPAIAGCIATASLLRLAFEPPAWKMKMASMVRGIWPGYSDSNNLDASMLSRDKEVVDRYVNDPLVHDRITVGALFSLLDAGKWNLEQAKSLRMPALLMHGTADQITDWNASKEFADKAGGRATFKAWEGMYHEIHNEPERQQVYDYTLGWMRGILK